MESKTELKKHNEKLSDLNDKLDDIIDEFAKELKIDKDGLEEIKQNTKYGRQQRKIFHKY